MTTRTASRQHRRREVMAADSAKIAKQEFLVEVRSILPISPSSRASACPLHATLHVTASAGVEKTRDSHSEKHGIRSIWPAVHILVVFSEVAIPARHLELGSERCDDTGSSF